MTALFGRVAPSITLPQPCSSLPIRLSLCSLSIDTVSLPFLSFYVFFFFFFFCQLYEIGGCTSWFRGRSYSV